MGFCRMNRSCPSRLGEMILQGGGLCGFKMVWVLSERFCGGVCHRGMLWDDSSVWGAGPKARMGVRWVRYCSQTKLAEPEDV